MLLLAYMFRFLGFILKVLYGFHHEGVENLPHDGPYIIVVNEFSILSILGQMVFTSSLLPEKFFGHKVLSFAAEEMWAVPGMGFIFTRLIAARPLQPHGAKTLSLHLLEALEYLKQGGIVIINPEGDMSRDGRTLPLARGVAWLGLHSGVPLVPVVLTAGAYDIWPVWRNLPSLRGRMVQRIGKPFKLTETPLDRVAEADLDTANARIRAEIDCVRYGRDGIAAYTGPPRRGAAPVELPVRLRSTAETAAADRPQFENRTPVLRRGMALLLWRCPVCRTNDALVDRRPWLRPETVECRACATRWSVRRVPDKDFRLRVEAGPADVRGLDMALSTWYDEMKRDVEPVPLPANGVALLAGEEVYLETRGTILVAKRTSPLFDPATGREPPRREVVERGRTADWARLGHGTLSLTNRRLIWEGEQRGFDFWWPSVTAVTLRWFSLLTVNYGVPSYRFILMHDNALKWLTYAGAVIPHVESETGQKVTLSPY